MSLNLWRVNKGIGMIRLIKYGLIGLINTFIHWSIFGVLYFLGFKQYLCNFIGFFFAVIFSYMTNAKFNFKSEHSVKKFILFFCLMGYLNLGIGSIADKLELFPLLTLIISSMLSLFLGYFLSKYFVFKEVK